MRKSFLTLSLVAVLALIAVPAMAANTWQQTNGPDTEGMESDELDFTGALRGLMDPGMAMEAPAGYDWSDGAIATTSDLVFDTDHAITAPMYALPCPEEQIGVCEYGATDPQTDDKGSAGMGEEGIILDDLFSYVEDYTDDTATGKHHIAQTLDTLFYVNATDANDPGAANGFTGDNVFKDALAIGQTLDQDLADFTGTSGSSPGNGIVAGIYQQFELGDDGFTRGAQSATSGDAIMDATVGLMDQVIWQQLEDIETGSGTQGISQKYVSIVIVGDGGDLCDVINVGGECVVNNTSDHSVTKNIDITDKFTIDETVNNDVVKTTTGP